MVRRGTGQSTKRGILTGASDASSSGWGGLIRGLHHDVFRAGGDFPPALAKEHINVQEGYALQQTLRLFCADNPGDVAGATLVSDVDNKVLHDAFKRGRARNTLMHDTIIVLVWLQVRHDFTLKLRWVSSAANADADDMSRPGSDDYVRLDERMFGELCEWAGDFDMDLMATPASVHKTWVGGHCTGEDLPFYSRYHTQGCAGVDVLSQTSRGCQHPNENASVSVFHPPTWSGCCCNISTNAGLGQWWCFRIKSNLGFPAWPAPRFSLNDCRHREDLHPFFAYTTKEGRNVFILRNGGCWQ